MRTIERFKEMNIELSSRAGGKGRTLAQLLQSGYPVPDGFVIFPEAFDDDYLKPTVWEEVQKCLTDFRKGNGDMAFAVRSSAIGEDSAQSSFGGQFETVTDVHSDEAVKAAITTVRHSRKSERVRAYSEAMHLAGEQDLAVVIQQLVRADISGVLFTADPVSGSHMVMCGNFVFGFGEELVSGEAEPFFFTYQRPKGQYTGPDMMKKYARKLFKLAVKLEKDLGCPQDIEWVVAGGKVFILQSRPITTLQSFNPETGEWNDSLKGDFMWSRNNMGEARPDVMSLLTFSLADMVWSEISLIPGYSYAGNICGRYYANISFSVSMLRVMGKNQAAIINELRGLLGNVPEDIDIPLLPLTRMEMIKAFPNMISLGLKENAGRKQVPEFIRRNPEWCQQKRQELKTLDASGLVDFWKQDIYPRMTELIWVLGGATQPFEQSQKINDKLVKLVGEVDANALLSGYSHENALLASLGPVYGIAKVYQGEMSHEEYMQKFGHRSPHEAELSTPYPFEDPEWLDRQLREFEKYPVDVERMLADRKKHYNEAWTRFCAQHPRQSKSLQSKIESVGPAAHLRENARSEMTRFLSVVRSWALRAGKVCDLGDDIFHFTINEVLELLSGDESALAYLEARKQTHEHYKQLPAYPMLIRGRFNPDEWAVDPNRRHDIFDAKGTTTIEDSDTLVGFAGAAGRVEGIVRVLHGPEEGDQFQTGEILVAVTTNVGWTPLFPRALAIVTDVGAPLSHAAIVARELGVPAVVGCSSATTRLKTGDRICVDGGSGVVEILEQNTVR